MLYLLLPILTLLFSSFGYSEPKTYEPFEQIRKMESLRHQSRTFSLDADSAHSYDQVSLQLEYRVENAGVPMTGIAYLTIVARQTMSEIPFNAEGLTITWVSIGIDTLVTFIQRNDTCLVQYGLNTGDTLGVSFGVSVPVIGNYNEGGYHVAWNRVFTFSEPYGARRWYPCWDQPYDKFNETTIAVNMPVDWSLASNGVLTTTNYPEAGRKREVYHNINPISSYLVCITAGAYSVWSEAVNGVNYRYFAYPEHEAIARYDWARIPQMVQLYDSLFGQYSFSGYGMAEAPLFNGWGAMEHQTMTTMGEHILDSTRFWEGIYAHELTHQWFGDALSPVDFRNMWLNEGFATYGHALWFEHSRGVEEMHNVLAGWATDCFNEDRTIRYPAYDPPPDHLFSIVVYEKGCWTLHMLRKQVMGDSLFFRGMNNYVNSHRYGNVDTEDFINSMSQTYGQDLHWFFNQWIYQAGYPELDVTVSVGNASVFVTVNQLQQNAPIFRFPLSIDIQTENGIETDTVWFDQAQQTRSIIPQSLAISASLSAYQPLLYQGTGASVPQENPLQPNEISLGSAYPNPFNSSTTIPFDLEKNAKINLSIFDITGRFVVTLADGNYSTGHHEFDFSPDGKLSSGIYIIKLESGSLQKLSKAVLLK